MPNWQSKNDKAITFKWITDEKKRLSYFTSTTFNFSTDLNKSFFSRDALWELLFWYINPSSRGKTEKLDFWDCNNSTNFKHQ